MKKKVNNKKAKREKSETKQVKKLESKQVKTVKTVTGVVLCMVFTVLMIMALSRKMNYHVDEIFSYGLANNHYGTFSVSFEDGERYEPSGTPFLDYVTAKYWNRFDYVTVWQLQTNDVHPPLYYAVLHTICSIFSDRFSLWQAAAVNILFGLLTLICLRKLLRLLGTGEMMVNISTVAFGCSAGTLSAVSFLRMYIMAMFWVTLLTYLFVRQTTIKTEGKTDWKFYTGILFTTLCGALTHYYCIVYAVLICVVYGIYLLGRKQWKDTLLFCGSMAVAGGLSYLIFPAMVEHIFHGQRGEQSFANFANADDYGERLRVFYGFFNDQMFGGKLTYLLVGIVLLGLYAVFVKKPEGGVVMQYLLVLLPCAVFFGLVSKTAVYQSDRYLFPIYAVGFAGIFSLAVKLLEQLWSQRIILFVSAGLAVLILWGSWQKVPWEYLYRSDQARIDAVKECSTLDCICIYDGARWKVQTDLLEYMNYNSITFLKKSAYDPNQIGELVQTDGVVVSMTGNVDAENTLAQIRECLPQYAECELIGNFGYSVSYVLR